MDEGEISMETTSTRRPQPLGAFPMPAGFLLFPEGQGDQVDHARLALAQGRIPTSWPDVLEGHRLAYAGMLEEAKAHFGGEAAVDRFNLFVLDPDSVDAVQLRVDMPADLAPLVDLLDYTLGRTEEPPALAGATDEVAALLLAGQASAELANGGVETAVGLLQAAAECAAATSPALSAVLLGNAGEIGREHALDDVRTIEDLTRAIDLLVETDLHLARAELHYQLASLIHDRAVQEELPLTEAVHHYYCALQIVDAKSAPYLWASAHLNLGTAYLTMPMVEATDQLRSGIAMQSLRASLEVFTKAEFPSEWSSAQVNLANALVYTPSTHQGDNLVEAVERYEEVLELRDRESDPLGRARLLMNQGNALAHLGIFDHARAKLYEARYLFEELGDLDAVRTVRGVLDEVSRESVPQDQRESASDVNGSVRS